MIRLSFLTHVLAFAVAFIPFTAPSLVAEEELVIEDYRPEIWGMNGNTPWTNLLPEEGLEGVDHDEQWQRDGDSIISPRVKESTFCRGGAEDWQHYEIDFYVTVVEGANLDVNFRSHGNKAYVFKFLLGWQAVAITRKDLDDKENPLEDLSVVNHKLERGKEYHVQICVRGASITSYINGVLVNQVTDKTYTKGSWSLESWNSSHRFRNVRYRRIG